MQYLIYKYTIHITLATSCPFSLRSLESYLLKHPGPAFQAIGYLGIPNMLGSPLVTFWFRSGSLELFVNSVE